MNKKVMTLAMASAFMAGLSLAATVTSVEARQRWPWNGKVDIVYTLQADGTAGCNIFDVKFKAEDDGTVVTMTTKSGEGANGMVFGAGQHILTWDAGTDYSSKNTEKMKFGVYAKDVTALCDYLKVDLATWEVTGESDKPETWSETDKSDYLWLKRVNPCTFKMGADTQTANPQHDVELTKSYFVGVFQLTRDQYNKIGGPKGTYDKPTGDGIFPANYISYYDLRGTNTATQFDWPNNGHQVASFSGFGKLRAKVKAAMGSDFLFDLPTEAQWECACRAGHEGNYWNDGTAENIVDNKDSHLNELAWYSNNASSNTHEVGGKNPSSWGFYDMHGNVYEWCLDWKADLTAAAATDPAGPTSGTYRLGRGGNYFGNASDCRSAYRGRNVPSGRNFSFGARVVLEFN